MPIALPATVASQIKNEMNRLAEEDGTAYLLIGLRKSWKEDLDKAKREGKEAPKAPTADHLALVIDDVPVSFTTADQLYLRQLARDQAFIGAVTSKNGVFTVIVSKSPSGIVGTIDTWLKTLCNAYSSTTGTKLKAATIKKGSAPVPVRGLSAMPNADELARKAPAANTPAAAVFSEVLGDLRDWHQRFSGKLRLDLDEIAAAQRILDAVDKHYAAWVDLARAGSLGARSAALNDLKDVAEVVRKRIDAAAALAKELNDGGGAKAQPNQQQANVQANQQQANVQANQQQPNVQESAESIARRRKAAVFAEAAAKGDTRIPVLHEADNTNRLKLGRQAVSDLLAELQPLSARLLAAMKDVEDLEAIDVSKMTKGQVNGHNRRLQEADAVVEKYEAPAVALMNKIKLIAAKFGIGENELKQLEVDRVQLDKDIVLFRQRSRGIAEAMARLADKRWKEEANQKVASYKLGKELGGGASGDVFLLRPPNKDDPALVMKVASEEDEDGNLREVAAYKAIGPHPNIAACLGIKKITLENGKEQEGMVLEHVDGADLKQVISTLEEQLKQKKISGSTFWSIVRGLTRDALEGLRHMHAQGYGHADIKPANIMFDLKRGRGVLVDLGLSRKEDVEVRGGSTGYNPALMREDGIDENRVEKAEQGLDLFAIGKTLEFADRQVVDRPFKNKKGQSKVAVSVATPTTAQMAVMMKLVRGQSLARGTIDETLADPFFADVDANEEKKAMDLAIKIMREARDAN